MSDTRRQQTSRFTAIFASGTMLSRVGGLVRDQVLMHFVPTAAMDAFVVAFRLPNMLRDLIGEGAANAAFIPVFSHTLEKDGREAFRKSVAACFGVMLILLAVVTGLGVFFAPLLVDNPLTRSDKVTAENFALMVNMTRWMFPYLFFIGIAVFTMGPLFSLKHYTTSSWSPVLLNVTLVATCLMCAWIPSVRRMLPHPAEAYALAIGVWLGGIAQVLVQWRSMGRHAGVWVPSADFSHPSIKAALLLLLPVLIGQATGEVNKLVDLSVAISFGKGIPKAMYAANSLVRLPQSIFGVAVSVAILPTLARAAARKDLQEIRVTLMEGLRETYYLILPAMLGLVALNEPIIRLLFQHGSFTPLDTRNTAAVLGLFAWGLLAFAWIKVAVTGFYADKRTGPPVIVASISMALNIVLIFAFKDWLGFRGLALATIISYSVNFIGLYILLCRRYGNLWDAPFVNALWRITAAGVAMALATGAARAGLEQTFSVDTVPIRCVIVFVPMALAVAVYLACCQILKVSEQEYFVSLLNRNKMKSPSDSSDDKDKRK